MAKNIKWTAPLAPPIGNPGAPAYTGTILGGAPDHAWQAEHKARQDEVARESARRREELQKFYESLVKWVPDALKSSSLDQEDKEFLSNNQARLRDSLRLLDSLLEVTSSPVRRNEICYLITEAIWSASAVALFSPPVSAISRLVKANRAEYMRHKRELKNEPKEIALLNAIAKHTTILSITRPAKEAAAILDDVNRELAEQEYPKVKVDVVRRRLNDFRALQERTKS